MSGDQRKYARQRARRGFSDQDLWDMNHWFLTLMPKMLSEYKKQKQGCPCCLDGNATDVKSYISSDNCHKEWNEILDRMILLFRETQEDTCSKKNEYEQEYHKALQAFEQDYGLLGEKLETPEEKERGNKTHTHTVHFMSEVPEYEEISRKYTEREDELNKYREACRLEAMALFTKWLPYLWN